MLALYVRARNWAQADEGATALEYGLLVALIAIAIAAAVMLFGTQLHTFFDNIATETGIVTAP